MLKAKCSEPLYLLTESSPKAVRFETNRRALIQDPIAQDKEKCSLVFT